eukprot:g3651.t1
MQLAQLLSLVTTVIDRNVNVVMSRFLGIINCRLEPTAEVQLAIASSVSQCSVEPDIVAFSASNYSLGKTITIALTDNSVDEGSNAHAFICKVFHNATSVDEYYKNISSTSFSITGINNDYADVKLQLSEPGTSAYKMKVLGTLNVVEGNSVTYSIVLDSMPTENVTIKTLMESTKNNSWFSVNVTPAVITFMPSTWNVNKMINVSVLEDKYVSDPEIFIITHFATTSDSIFQSKATNNTVIVNAISDDKTTLTLDTNCVSMDTDVGSDFKVVSLGAVPSADVSISIADPNSKFTFGPNSFTVSKNNWASIDKKVQVTTSDTPRGLHHVSLTCTSDDTHFNGVCGALTVGVPPTALEEQSADGTPPSLDLIYPKTIKVMENGAFEFDVRLNLNSYSSTVTPSTSSNNCVVNTGSVSLSGLTPKQISGTVGSDNIDQGDGKEAFKCLINLDDTSQNLQATAEVSVTNDDLADFKLLVAVGGDVVKLKLIGPIFLTEGSNFSYSMVLETEPLANIELKFEIRESRENTVNIKMYPSSLYFSTSNWNQPQLVTMAVSEDDIDNDLDVEAFEIIHYVQSTDAIFESRAANSTALVQVMDNDEANILVSDNALQLSEGGLPQVFEISRLTSQPLDTVQITITSTTDLILISPKNFSVSSQSWKGINKAISVRAQSGSYASGTTFKLTIECSSNDPKYNLMSTTKPLSVLSNDATPGMIGIPAEGFITESGVFRYSLSLTKSPASTPVNIIVSSAGNGCNVIKSKLTFTVSAWNAKKEVEIAIADDKKFFAKGSVSYTCEITHSIETQDVDYKNLLSRSFTLYVTSNGCGDGEFLGEYDRGNNGTQCVCSRQYFLSRDGKCAICPSDKSECNDIGLTAPPVKPGWWRADPTKPDLVEIPFYFCPFPGSCKGGNSTKNRCSIGHNNDGPLCATCSKGYVLLQDNCVFCEGRSGADEFSYELLGCIVGGICLLMLGTYVFITQSPLSNEEKNMLREELGNLNPLFLFEKNSSIDRKKFHEFNKTLSTSQLDLAFDEIDKDGSGTIELTEWRSFVGKNVNPGIDDIDDDVQEIGKATIEEMSLKIEENSSMQIKNLWCTVQPIIIHLEALGKDLTEQFYVGQLDFETKLLLCTEIVIEEIDVSPFISEIKQRFRKSLTKLNSKIEEITQKADEIKLVFLGTLKNLENVMIKLQSLVVDLSNQLHIFRVACIDFPLFFEFDELWTNFNLQLGIKDMDLTSIEAIKNDLKDSFQKLHLAADKLRTSAEQSLENAIREVQTLLTDELPKFNVKFSHVHMEWSIGNMFGDWRGQVKIFLGFAQCFAYLSVTFDVPWPRNVRMLMKLMEFTALDVYAILGYSSCQMQTGYLDKFASHMALFPAILLIILAVYIFAKNTKCRRKYTSESLRTSAYTLLSLISFAVYTGISTRIFRLFKCQEVQNVWYLQADFSVKCQEDRWNTNAIFAGIFMVLYVIGIPFVQLYLLYTNRDNLHKDECKDTRLQHMIEKEYGSIYLHYVNECYYFDIVDLFRRLVLTGGLILMGENSIGQVFLGILICIIWLCLLLYKRPYKAPWDNITAIILSFHLVLMLLSGMALKLYATSTTKSVYETSFFDFMMVFVSILCIVLGISSIVAGVPCIRSFIVKKLEKAHCR